MAILKNKKINKKSFHEKLFDHLNPKSYFSKTYLSYAALIVTSFSLMTAIFISQVSVYSLNEKKVSLSYTINTAKNLTEIIRINELSEYPTISNLYKVNMMQIAEEATASLMLSDLEGNIIFYYNANNPLEKKENLGMFPVSQTLNSGTHSEIGTMSGFFDEITYIQSAIVYDKFSEPSSIILIGMPAASISSLIYDLSKIFVLVLAVMLLLILLVSYFMASRITSPLKNISEASQKFAKGDFSVRVPEETKCFEIDNLSKSINQMASTLELSEKKRATFIENVSHELKTPMTSIGGFVDGILDGTIPKDRQEYYLKIISEEVKRLSRLTVRMLKTSRIQSDTFTITKAPFDFSDTISRVIISFENKLIAKNINLSVSLDENAFAYGDRDNIYQVIYNLTDNAIKFTNPSEKVEITLKKSGNFYIFSISNQSELINPEKLQHLFDRFYKVDESRSEDVSGAGLGLYIVKKIIALHDSTISVSSVNGYTTFSFSLPISDVKKQNLINYTP